MLDALRRRPALGQTQLKVVLHGGEEVLETVRRPTQKALQQRLFIRLEAAGHAVLVDVTAAIGEATLTYVLRRAGGVHIATAVDEDVLSVADVAELVREKGLALDGVPTLGDLTTAVA